MNTIGFFKRLLIICYDGLLLLGVILLASVILPLLPDALNFSPLGKAIKGVYLLSITFLFYGWFWTHGGQTLGMKVWKLYLVDTDGQFINWTTAFVRFIAAIFSLAAIGLGFTWILLDRRRRAWHDIISKTQILYVPNPQAQSPNDSHSTN